MTKNRRVRFHRQTRRWVVAAKGTFMVLLAVVVSGCKEDSRLPAPSEVPATQPASVNEVQNEVQLERELSDAELLGSTALTFEQKRSKLYALMDVAEAGVGYVRHEANYSRTNQRLAGYWVKFTPEAEHSFLGLVERVQSYLNRAQKYEDLVIRREASVRLMEAAMYDEMKSNRLDPSARSLFIEIVSQNNQYVMAPFGWVFARDGASGEYVVTGDARRRILRRTVGADDLFQELVAIRACQRSVDILGEVDERVSRLLQKLPDQVLSVGGFSRTGNATQEQLDEARAELAKLQEARGGKSAAYQDDFRYGQRSLNSFLAGAAGSATRDSTELQIQTVRQRVSDLELALQDEKPIGVVMPRETRAELLSRLSKDAGLVEASLRELLLDYPWPWPVPTLATTENAFSITSRPSQ